MNEKVAFVWLGVKLIALDFGARLIRGFDKQIFSLSHVNTNSRQDDEKLSIIYFETRGRYLD